MSLNKTLSAIFREVLNYRGELVDDLNPSSVSGWDSVAHIALVEAMESRFDINLTTEEMVEMNSVLKIKDILADYHIQD